MYLYIDNVYREYIRNSIKIKDELQEKTNTSSFKLDGSFDVNYYEDVNIYQGAKIVSLSTTTLIVDREYSNDTFRVGGEIWLGLGKTTLEKVTIESVNGTTITLTASADSAHIEGERMGVLMFGGNIVDIQDYNIGTLNNIELQIQCIDYTRLFDKELINESYENRDARYIVNDFCNQFVNKNFEIDQFDYADSTALNAVWTPFNSTLNAETSDYRESIGSMEIVTVGSGSLDYAKREFSPVLDVSSYSGNSIGVAIRGVLGFWIKTVDYTKITTFTILIGTGADYFEIEKSGSIIGTNEWKFIELNLKDFTVNVGGSPNWSNVENFYFIINDSASTTVYIDGIRILETEFFRHYPYVESNGSFSDFRISQTKPIEVMQRLADELSWFWYIDYERNIRLFKQSTNQAPFDLNATSDNFSNLQISWDTSKLVNSQIVKGADQTSVSTYSEVREGDGISREWLTKTKFVNLVVSIDDGTSTDTTEAGTTTTNVTATAHGLISGDYIVNRSRSNAVRKITYVDANNFTVEVVLSQTSGDTFSKFTLVDVGVEGINLDTGYNYMSNYNEKSIRSSETETTLESGEFILFAYNEVVPILVQSRSDTSINNMVNILGYTNGVFDGATIVDRTIKTRAEAIALSNVYINKYENVIIKASFVTTYEGLVSGQLINITDTNKRNINQDFIIQKVVLREVENGENVYTVTCSTSLFGIIEFFQQLLKQGRKLEVNEDATVEKILTINENITVTDVVNAYLDDENVGESLSVSDVVNTTIFEPPYKWGVDADDGDWNLFEWS